ncbi:MAG: hydrogenase maturation nickel metallochaperone HypA [Dongiaceae bacterium]
MHEMGITRNIVAIVSEHAGERRVRRVTLEIGRLSAVMPDAIAFCFDVVAAGTACEGARLEIEEVPGRAECRSCGRDVALDGPLSPCGACGSRLLRRTAGEELKVKEMELELG